MKTIDFLPQRYRERGAVERARLWQFGVVALVAGAVAVAALYQTSARRSVEARLAEIEPRYAEAQAKTQRVAELNQRLTREGATADLVTYLRHPWPRSQILARLAEQLSTELTLTEIRLLREQPERPPVVSERPATAVPGAATPPPPSPAMQDLETLRAECDHGPLVLLVAGDAASAAALHAYLDRLKATRLFARAELASITNRQTERLGGGQAEFQLRLVLLPGYGQPGGPAVSIAEPTSGIPLDVPVEPSARAAELPSTPAGEAELPVAWEEDPPPVAEEMP